MVPSTISEGVTQFKKYMLPKAISLSECDNYIAACEGGAGDIGCGTGLSAAYDCVTNGAAAQVSRSYNNTN